MLGKLVNKFKKHSLQEEVTSSTGSIAPLPNNLSSANNKATTTTTTSRTIVTTPLIQQPNRRSARISAIYEENNTLMIDSGTESDDDELEQLDSNLNRAPSSDIMGSSPPNLTSSPPLASEFETDRFVRL
uniref:Uncharacterized protein n=1 Tax=Setaria digitata TaxID=48799 RepID=A0A915PML7_9BILA